jgi:hypothetical protein
VIRDSDEYGSPCGHHSVRDKSVRVDSKHPSHVESIQSNSDGSRDLWISTWGQEQANH